MAKTVKLESGHVYKITYKLQAGNYRWYKYEATMTYLGYNKMNKETIWSLRPLAGTQSLPYQNLISASHIGSSEGREDSRHKLKKNLGAL